MLKGMLQACVWRRLWNDIDDAALSLTYRERTHTWMWMKTSSSARRR